jgi:superfamily I DNA and/or RNA helicase
VWVDTGERGNFQSSEQEARIICELVTEIRRAGIPSGEIAVLTPFRQQVRELQAKLAASPATYPAPRVDTVERLQGQEAEVALVSLACSHPSWLAEAAKFYFEDSRWNVAASRAKSKLIFVGSLELCNTNPQSPRAAASMRRFIGILQGAMQIARHQRTSATQIGEQMP